MGLYKFEFEIEIYSAVARAGALADPEAQADGHAEVPADVRLRGAGDSPQQGAPRADGQALVAPGPHHKVRVHHQRASLVRRAPAPFAAPPAAVVIAAALVVVASFAGIVAAGAASSPRFRWRHAPARAELPEAVDLVSITTRREEGESQGQEKIAVLNPSRGKKATRADKTERKISRWELAPVSVCVRACVCGRCPS